LRHGFALEDVDARVSDEAEEPHARVLGDGGSDALFLELYARPLVPLVLDAVDQRALH
jgi:hypothetical protein